MLESLTPPRRRLKLFAWGLLLYTLPVILWGAFVRASFSGDGCGDHWPLCDGEVIPVEAGFKKMVELTHRVTSGFAWIGAFVAMLWARRLYGPGEATRRAGGWVFFFMSTEALVGAAIVVLRMVATNQSLARAGWMAAHLSNTFLLLGAMVLFARSAQGFPIPRLRQLWRHRGLSVAVVLAIATGMSGAVAALGDTLFPAESLAEGIRADFSPTAHILVRLRIWHPLIALVAAATLLWIAGKAWAQLQPGKLRRLGIALGLGAIVQVLLGLLNVLLMAPIWMQLVHLAVADLLWLGLILYWSMTEEEIEMTSPSTKPI